MIMEKRLYAIMVMLGLCLSMSNHAVSQTWLEQCKAKQKDIALLEKKGDKAALAQAKKELTALFNDALSRDESSVSPVDCSQHAVIHETYLNTKNALEELHKGCDFLSSRLFNYHTLTRQEQLLLDEIKAFLDTQCTLMGETLQLRYEQWSTTLDTAEVDAFIRDASIINNRIEFLASYFYALNMVRMQVELLTIDNREAATLATPVNQMLQDQELQSACLTVAAQLFERMQTLWASAAHQKFEITPRDRNHIILLLGNALPKRFHGSWWSRWLGYMSSRSLLTFDVYDKNPAWCHDYLRLQKACTSTEIFADKNRYQEVVALLNKLYQEIHQAQIDCACSGRVSNEGLTYKILIYKLLSMKKDLKKFEHYNYDVAKEGIAAKHAVLVQSQVFKKIFTTREFAYYGDQYQKIVDLYLYNQAKPSLLMFELYKLDAQLKEIREKHKLSKVMWLFFKENMVCQLIDDMIYILEYIALDISNSKGFEKNSIIEHILAGAWTANGGGSLQKKSFFSDIVSKLFGKSNLDVQNQMLKALGYASPVVATTVLKMLMPYLTDESQEQKSACKDDDKTPAHKETSLIDPKLLESLASQWNFQQQ